MGAEVIKTDNKVIKYVRIWGYNIVHSLIITTIACLSAKQETKLIYNTYIYLQVVMVLTSVGTAELIYARVQRKYEFNRIGYWVGTVFIYSIPCIIMIK